jgi:type III secretory pathway component EscS
MLAVTLSALISSFIHDDQFKTVIALIVVDLVLGVAAAFYTGQFALTYLANFARNDLLGKVVPFFVLHSAAVVGGGVDIVIPGVDLSALSDSLFVVIVAALVGSLITSLGDFGIQVPDALSRRGSARRPNKRVQRQLDQDRV